MPERTISASRFKAECLGLLDEVATTGQALVVTKRGKAIARVIAFDPVPSLLGSVTYAVGEEELIAPIDERWDAECR